LSEIDIDERHVHVIDEVDQSLIGGGTESLTTLLLNHGLDALL
jgi:hypothetical protein